MSKTRSLLQNKYFQEGLFYAFALLCMMCFVLIQPFGEGPDEINRYRVVRFIADTGRLPRGDDPAVLIPGYGGSYAFQPMLTYILEGWVVAFLRLFTSRFDVLLIGARMVNVAFGLGAAFYARRLSRLLFPEALTQWAFSCLVVFLPQSLFLHTYVNTDSCALFSVFMMFTQVLAGMRRGFDRGVCIRLGISVTLCALSYYNAYGAVLVTILLFVSAFIRRIPAGRITGNGTAFPMDQYEFRWQDMLRKGSLISLIVLAGAGWWFIRNAFLYQGDFLGMEARNECVAATCTPQFHPLLRQTCQNQGMGVLEMVFGTDYFILLLRSFVAMFGPMNVPTHYYIYTVYYWLFGLGLAAAALPVGRPLSLHWESRKHRWLIHGGMVMACVIPIFLCVYYSYTWDFQPQGRYLMPMLPAFLYLVTLGVRKILLLLQALTEKGADRLSQNGNAEGGLRASGIHFLRWFSARLPQAVLWLVILFTLAAAGYSVFLVMLPHYI